MFAAEVIDAVVVTTREEGQGEHAPRSPLVMYAFHLAYLMCCNSQDLVSDATRIKFDRVREQITTIHHVISSMLQFAHSMENRSVAFSRDLKQLSSDLM